MNREPRVAERPGASSYRLVLGVFTLLLVLGIALGAVIHRRYVAFERVAAHHVPNDVALVVRWEIEKVTLFEPTRRHLLPLLDASEGARTPRGETRRRRMARESGLDIGRDLREVVALFGPQPNDWAVVFGGSFPEAGVLDALERGLRAERRSVTRVGSDRLVVPGGASFGRSPDGALVLASSRERLEAVLPIRALNSAIARTGAGAFLVRPDEPGLPAAARGVLTELGDVSRVEGRAATGTPVLVEIDVHYRGAIPSDALARARRTLVRVLGSGIPATLELGPGTPGRDGPVTFRVRLNDDALGRSAERVADSIHETVWRRDRPLAVP